MSDDAAAAAAGWQTDPYGEANRDAAAPQFDLPAGSDIGQLGVIGADGLSVEHVNDQLRQGARFVVYPYVISLLIITLRRGSGVYFIPAGKSAVPKGLPFAAISLVLGWWGFPWGFIFTPIAVVRNLTGGKNVTAALVEAVNSHSREATASIAAAAAAEGPRSGVLQTIPSTAAPGQTQVAPASTPSSSPAGWHPDPTGQARLRYWDGQAWTDHTHD